ncbi:hypothetical protein E5676_scaffold434G005020 [Cucumis melo var. makuwa]|uniref:Uncharacterized protein n=1 Tax=Cucumis melo var. makuwa TaxID=1194695 RepID=A0A5D3D078_CUCMM|nr:hypothetical protein E5676_scaffold434G005020 [Cucumis melo var. makuwa]
MDAIPMNESSPSPIRHVLREWNNLLKRSRKRSREWRIPTNRTRTIKLQPSIDTTEMEVVSTLRHHPQHLRILILTETDGADTISSSHGFISGEREFRVRVNNGLVKTHNPVVIVAIWGGVVLSDENDLGENDAGFGAGRRRWRAAEVAGTGSATANVESEEKGGEEDEEGECYGNGVAEADPGEGISGRRGGHGE